MTVNNCGLKAKFRIKLIHRPFFMNFKILLCAFLFFSVRAFSQTTNNISVLYGLSSTSVDIHGAIGDFGYANKTGTSYGATYSRNFSKIFSVETGVILYDDKAEIHSIQPGRDVITDGDVKLITVPIIGKWTFFNCLFIETGISIDKQTNYSSNSVVSSQSGLGNEFGFGGTYTFKHISVFVNPYWREFSIINFSSNNENRNLIDIGVKFGLGYNF
jgi:hypothetical protein